MKHTLTTTTLIAGLVTSLACPAQSELSACLADNADKQNKMTVCLDQLHKSMADSKKQELQQKYDQTLTDLNKQDQSKKNANPTPQIPTPPSTSATDSTSADSSTTSSASTSNGSSTDTATSSAPSTSNTTDQSTTPQKKSVDVRPEPRDKPKGVQWY